MTKAELNGLRGEVIVEDIYGLRTLTGPIDVVFDLGANVGLFAEHARSLFPEAKIVCVEPHPENFAELQKRHGHDPKIVLINRAIGDGPVFHAVGAANGSCECYLPAGFGYDLAEMRLDPRLTESEIRSIGVDDLVGEYAGWLDRYVIKMDIEGAENAVFADPLSRAALRGAAHLAIEVHHYALNAEVHPEMVRNVDRVLAEFGQTHDCQMKHVIFTARRK